MAEMNARQQRSFDKALDYALMRGHYEVKDLAIDGNGYDEGVHVLLEVGMPNDEGTMAEAFCRSCYSFYIGEKGGMYVYNGNHNREYIKYYDLNLKTDIYRLH